MRKMLTTLVAVSSHRRDSVVDVEPGECGVGLAVFLGWSGGRGHRRRCVGCALLLSAVPLLRAGLLLRARLLRARLWVPTRVERLRLGTRLLSESAACGIARRQRRPRAAGRRCLLCDSRLRFSWTKRH